MSKFRDLVVQSQGKVVTALVKMHVIMRKYQLIETNMFLVDILSKFMNKRINNVSLSYYQILATQIMNKIFKSIFWLTFLGAAYEFNWQVFPYICELNYVSTHELNYTVLTTILCSV